MVQMIDYYPTDHMNQIKEICQNTIGFFRNQEVLQEHGCDIITEVKEVNGNYWVPRTGDILAGFYLTGAETGDIIDIIIGGNFTTEIIVDNPARFYLPIGDCQMHWYIASQFSSFEVLTSKPIKFNFVHIRLPHELRCYMAQGKFIFKLPNEDKKLYYGSGCATAICESFPDFCF